MVYTQSMPRGPRPKPKGELLVNVGLKVPPEIRAELEQITSEVQESSPGTVKAGYIARRFFMRGLEAYRIDKKLEGAVPNGNPGTATTKAVSNRTTTPRKKKGAGKKDKTG